jgi:hypothetical protein
LHGANDVMMDEARQLADMTTQQSILKQYLILSYFCTQFSVEMSVP